MKFSRALGVVTLTAVALAGGVVSAAEA
ncbi:MAG: hypothetical protein RLZ72_182, partial [Actinomycetota bacterium]